MAIDYDQPIRCCGTSVFPGDWILADGDGAVVIPPPLAAEIAAEGSAVEHKETFIRERVLEHGYPLAEAYPPNERTLAEYEQWKSAPIRCDADRPRTGQPRPVVRR